MLDRQKSFGKCLDGWLVDSTLEYCMNDLKLGLPHDLRELFLLLPDQSLAMIDFYAHLLRGPSILSAGERELIYAYTSKQNGCHFCATSHRHCAVSLGVPQEVFDVSPENINAAPLANDEKHRLAFACALQRLDIAGVKRELGHILNQPESAQIDTVLIVGLTAFINRLIDGLGAVTTDEMHARAGHNLALHGYTKVRSEVERSIKALGLEPSQRLPGLQEGWPKSENNAQEASQTWLAAYSNLVFEGSSQVPRPLLAAVREAVFAISEKNASSVAKWHTGDGSADALLDFAVAIGIDKRRSDGSDFEDLRTLGWGNDRDIIDAVLAAATAACAVRISIGLRHLGLS
jgi:AhpD family alkylhydroperoxidase